MQPPSIFLRLFLITRTIWGGKKKVSVICKMKFWDEGQVINSFVCWFLFPHHPSLPGVQQMFKLEKNPWKLSAGSTNNQHTSPPAFCFSHQDPFRSNHYCITKLLWTLFRVLCTTILSQATLNTCKPTFLNINTTPLPQRLNQKV